MIEFHQDFIRRRRWLKWNNWHDASDSQSMRNFLSKNILSFDRRDCSSWQSYLYLASKFCKDINEHLLSWKNCCSNDVTYVINLQRWKWCKDHWLNIDSLNCESSYLWWIMTYIDDLDSMKEIMIIIHVHALYQTLLSCIQSIFVLLILKYVEKLLESRSNEDSDRVHREMNDKRRLIVQDLCNDLNYHHEKLRIQLYIDWRIKNDEWRWDDDIMLLNLILKLLHYTKDLNWIFNHTLSELFNSTLIIDQEIVKWLHLSERITRRDFNVWKRYRKCRSFVMLKTELD